MSTGRKPAAGQSSRTRAARYAAVVPHGSFYRGLEAAQTQFAALAGPSPEQFAAAAQTALTPLLVQSPAPRACRVGCTSCCRHLVGVGFAETVAVARAVAALPATRRDGVESELRRAAAMGRELDDQQGIAARAPCPLLHDGACAVYEARPLPCRALFSADADACRADAAGQPLPGGVPFDAAAFAAGLGAAAALALAAGPRGWPTQRRELRSALAAVLACSAAGMAAMAAAFQAARPLPGDGVTGTPEPG